VIAYCEREKISFTRGRPYLKNDQCFVEQKNGAIVRQVVGYDRLVGKHASASVDGTLPGAAFVSQLLQSPRCALLSKERDGKKVRSVYDPAKTPLQRLLQSGVVLAEMQQELTEVARALDPISLFQQLVQLQQAVFRCAVDSSPFLSSPLADPLHIFAVEQCTAGKLTAERSVPVPNAGLDALYREQERRKRVHCFRRTHKDPFEGEWDTIFSWLQANPERPQRRYLGGIAALFTRTLSAFTHPHLTARHAGNPSLSVANR
jgi:hypothetical protein